MSDEDMKPWKPEPLDLVPPKASSKTLPLVLGALVLLGFAGIVWYVYSLGQEHAKPGQVPIVMAETTPDRTIPENRGGLEVPHQDKLVYSAMQGAGAPSVAGTTLPQAEEPLVNTSELATTPAAEVKPAVTETVAVPVPAVTPASAPTPERAVETKPIATPTTPATVPAKPAPKAATAPKPKTDKPAAKAAAATGVRVQLAAVDTRAKAQSTWAALQKKIPALQPLTLAIQEVQVKGKGTLYRVQAGTLASRAEAEQLCRTVKAAGQDCLVAVVR